MSFLAQCKLNYQKAIRPSNMKNKDSDNYKKTVSIALSYFENDEKTKFKKYFSEYQYNVNLWAAHLLLEYSNYNKEEEVTSLEIIARYCTTPLDNVLAEEEKEWLKQWIVKQESHS